MSGDRWQARSFRDDEDCDDLNEWCTYPEAHRHGFGCDTTCPCRDRELGRHIGVEVGDFR